MNIEISLNENELRVVIEELAATLAYENGLNSGGNPHLISGCSILIGELGKVYKSKRLLNEAYERTETRR